MDFKRQICYLNDKETYFGHEIIGSWTLWALQCVNNSWTSPDNS